MSERATMGKLVSLLGNLDRAPSPSFLPSFASAQGRQPTSESAPPVYFPTEPVVRPSPVGRDPPVNPGEGAADGATESPPLAWPAGVALPIRDLISGNRRGSNWTLEAERDETTDRRGGGVACQNKGHRR